jgi:hypothetical protein
MRILTGTVIDACIVVEGEGFIEGERVTVLRREGNEMFTVSDEEHRVLHESIAQADRGEFVHVDELLSEIES